MVHDPITNILLANILDQTSTRRSVYSDYDPYAPPEFVKASKVFWLFLFVIFGFVWVFAQAFSHILGMFIWLTFGGLMIFDHLNRRESYRQAVQRLRDRRAADKASEALRLKRFAEEDEQRRKRFDY